MWKQKRVRLNRGGLLLLLVVGVVFMVFWMIDRNVYPMLLSIAKTEVKKIAQESILMGIREQVTMGDQLKHIMEVEKGQDGKITSIKIDPTIQGQIYTRTAIQIQKKLKLLEEKPITISLGQALQSNLFSEYGPNFRVEVIPKGATQIEVIPKLESKGINMVMVTLILKIKTEMGIVVPFTEDKVALHTQYPIAQAFVVGEVPQYYFYNDQDGKMQKKETNPSVSVHPPVPNQ